ncbi:MAG TPA: hypothetical protein PK819_14220, partial [Thermomicrobiales bacterium]|nr:hypothetical protein [Thermomicrobiales bacterium]
MESISPSATRTVPAWHGQIAWGNMLPILGAAIVLLIATWRFTDNLHESAFHPDESRWINRSAYLQELGDPLGSFWSDSYLIRGQPPMG